MGTMPVGYCSLMTTDLFGLASKLEVARFLAAIPSVRISTLHNVSLGRWLRTQLHDARVMEFVMALVRFTTYVHDPDRLSAAAAVEQLALSLAGPVLYIHQGWGTLIAALKSVAVSLGATVISGQRVVAVNMSGRRAVSVTLAGGEVIAGRAVIGAIGPARARALIARGTIPAATGAPICVASLDVALRRLPAKCAVFAIGVDVPVSADAESLLEGTLDLLQPGWRDLVVFRRFLPSVLVSHALIAAERGGILGPPDGRLPDIDNVFLAGDWIGPIGQLADASVSSGIRAAYAVHCRSTAT